MARAPEARGREARLASCEGRTLPRSLARSGARLPRTALAASLLQPPATRQAGTSPRCPPPVFSPVLLAPTLPPLVPRPANGLTRNTATRTPWHSRF